MTPDKVEAALGVLRWLVHNEGRLSELEMSMPEALSVLTEALAESRRDAARLDWLEDAGRCYHVDIQSQPSGNYVFKGQGQFLRHAIDLAMKETP